MAGRAKENFSRGSLKYLFVYLKVCIFKCSYGIYIYVCIHHITWYRILSYHILSHHIISCHIVSCRIIPYHNRLYHIYTYHMYDIYTLYNIQYVSISYSLPTKDLNITQAWERVTTGGRAARGEKATLALCPKPSHFFRASSITVMATTSSPQSSWQPQHHASSSEVWAIGNAWIQAWKHSRARNPVFFRVKCLAWSPKEGLCFRSFAARSGEVVDKMYTGL